MRKLFLVAACAVLLFVACGGGEKHHNHDHHNHHNHHGHDHHEEEGDAHSDVIVFTSEQAKMAKIDYYTVHPVDFHEVIRVSGKILPARGDEMTVAATVSGIVLFGSAEPVVGREVGKGSPLFYISSKNISEGDYIARTRAAYEQACAAYERAERLVKDQIVSQRDFEQARYDYETARTAYEALNSSASEKGVKVTAPLSGFLSSVLVREGDYVNVGDPMAVVSQNRRLILQSEVPQRYYSALATVSTANFETPYNNKVYSLHELNGRLLSAGKSVADNSFYIPVSFSFNNPGDVISGSYVTVFLHSAPLRDVLTVPAASLTEQQGFYFVYVHEGGEHYAKREVIPGGNDGLNVLIREGLEAGEVVVSEGAYHIRLASVSGIIPEGHSHNH